MAFWKKNEQESAPQPETCPYCGGEMERMYLVSGRGLVHLMKEEPGGVLGRLLAETVPLKDGEGLLRDWLTCWKSCHICAACRKLVADVPEIEGAWSAEPPSEPAEDDGSTEAYERYVEQLKDYQ